MDQQKVDAYIIANQKFFPAEKILFLKEKLQAADEGKYSLITTLEMKDPTTMLIISIFLGGWGIDRFMLGDTGMGILKLLTGGLCGILWLIDVINISKQTQEANFNRLMTLL